MSTKPGLHVERSALAWRRTILAGVAGFTVTLRLAISERSVVLVSAIVGVAALLALGGLIARCAERRAAAMVVAVAAAAMAVSVDAVASLLGL